jgi:hypothetical protein
MTGCCGRRYIWQLTKVVSRAGIVVSLECAIHTGVDPNLQQSNAHTCEITLFPPGFATTTTHDKNVQVVLDVIGQ